ncbi:MAG: DUF817 domain-containing protein [Pseudomonadota bacterium]
MRDDLPPIERHRLALERRLGDWARGRLPAALTEFVMFGLKQAWAALFGGLLLAAIIVTKLVWQPDWALARYDFLVILAISIQAAFVAFRLESWREVQVIALFHVTGTVMEVFKIHMGSWAYPEPGVMKLMGVPLFSGFMYASVGSYIARVIRVFDMRFAHAPPLWAFGALAGLIYLNFFTHHFGPDIRLGLFAGTVVLCWRTRIWFLTDHTPRWMPLVVAAFLTALFLFIAEVVGTLTATWVYAGAARGVPLAKFGSWYLLLYVSFFLVLTVYRDVLHRGPAPPYARA